MDNNPFSDFSFDSARRWTDRLPASTRNNQDEDPDSDVGAEESGRAERFGVRTCSASQSKYDQSRIPSQGIAGSTGDNSRGHFPRLSVEPSMPRPQMRQRPETCPALDESNWTRFYDIFKKYSPGFVNKFSADHVKNALIKALKEERVSLETVKGMGDIATLTEVQKKALKETITQCYLWKPENSSSKVSELLVTNHEQTKAATGVARRESALVSPPDASKPDDVWLDLQGDDLTTSLRRDIYLGRAGGSNNDATLVRQANLPRTSAFTSTFALIADASKTKSTGSSSVSGSAGRSSQKRPLFPEPKSSQHAFEGAIRSRNPLDSSSPGKERSSSKPIIPSSEMMVSKPEGIRKQQAPQKTAADSLSSHLKLMPASQNKVPLITPDTAFKPITPAPVVIQKKRMGSPAARNLAEVNTPDSRQVPSAFAKEIIAETRSAIQPVKSAKQGDITDRVFSGDSQQLRHILSGLCIDPSKHDQIIALKPHSMEAGELDHTLNYEIGLGDDDARFILEHLKPSDEIDSLVAARQKSDMKDQAKRAKQIALAKKARDKEEAIKRFYYEHDLPLAIEFSLRDIVKPEYDVLVVGSQIDDRTGRVFDKRRTVFADAQGHSDLNGDIHITVDDIPSGKQFKEIHFTGLPGYVFNSAEKNRLLFQKLNCLMEDSGKLFVEFGANSQDYNNQLFIDSILKPEGFGQFMNLRADDPARPGVRLSACKVKAMRTPSPKGAESSLINTPSTVIPASAQTFSPVTPPRTGSANLPERPFRANAGQIELSYGDVFNAYAWPGLPDRKPVQPGSVSRNLEMAGGNTTPSPRVRIPAQDFVRREENTATDDEIKDIIKALEKEYGRLDAEAISNIKKNIRFIKLSQDDIDNAAAGGRTLLDKILLECQMLESSIPPRASSPKAELSQIELSTEVTRNGQPAGPLRGNRVIENIPLTAVFKDEIKLNYLIQHLKDYFKRNGQEILISRESLNRFLERHVGSISEKDFRAASAGAEDCVKDIARAYEKWQANENAGSNRPVGLPALAQNPQAGLIPNDAGTVRRGYAPWNVGSFIMTPNIQTDGVVGLESTLSYEQARVQTLTPQAQFHQNAFRRQLQILLNNQSPAGAGLLDAEGMTPSLMADLQRGNVENFFQIEEQAICELSTAQYPMTVHNDGRVVVQRAAGIQAEENNCAVAAVLMALSHQGNLGLLIEEGEQLINILNGQRFGLDPQLNQQLNRLMRLIEILKEFNEVDPVVLRANDGLNKIRNIFGLTQGVILDSDEFLERIATMFRDLRPYANMRTNFDIFNLPGENMEEYAQMSIDEACRKFHLREVVREVGRENTDSCALDAVCMTLDQSPSARDAIQFVQVLSGESTFVNDLPEELQRPVGRINALLPLLATLRERGEGHLKDFIPEIRCAYALEYTSIIHPSVLIEKIINDLNILVIFSSGQIRNLGEELIADCDNFYQRTLSNEIRRLNRTRILERKPELVTNPGLFVVSTPSFGFQNRAKMEISPELTKTDSYGNIDRYRLDSVISITCGHYVAWMYDHQRKRLIAADSMSEKLGASAHEKVVVPAIVSMPMENTSNVLKDAVDAMDKRFDSPVKDAKSRFEKLQSCFRLAFYRKV